MKQKFIISIAVIALLIIIGLIAKDLFVNPIQHKENPYEYNIDNLKKIDSTLICYDEVLKITPKSENIIGIAINEDDEIYITSEKKIFVFDKTGTLLNEISTQKNVNALNFLPNKNLVVSYGNRLKEINQDGEEISSWKSLNEKSLFTSLAVNKTSVYAADAGNKVVLQYNFEGEIMKEIGRKDTSRNIPGFIIPSGYFDLLIGRIGELWVVNPGFHALYNFNTNGDIVSSWERTSMQLEGFSGCCNPSHIAMLSDGSFVTSEKGIERIKIHDQLGNFKCVVAAPNIFKEGTKGLDLAVDSNDRIYVLDPVKKVVKVFQKKTI
jgi:hypothetical protein